MRKVLGTGLTAVALLVAVMGIATGVRAALDHAIGVGEVLGALLVVTLLWSIGLRPRVGRHAVIELDLPQAPTELPDRSPLARLRGGPSMTLADTVAALRRAARDPRVAALVVRPRFDAAPLAVIDELREAVIDLRQRGKRTIAVTDTFGEGGPANAAYLLATACAEIVVHPTGLVGLTPLAAEPNFYRGLFDRLGVGFEVVARHEYKNAFNQLSERGFTPPHREATARVIESLWEQVVDAVSTGRALEPDVVRSLADKGPLLATEARDAGLVDRLAYTDEVVSDAKGTRTKKLLSLASYNKRAGRRREKGNAVPVAVVSAVGEIVRSRALPIGITGGPVLAADELTTTLRAVAKNKKVKAMVLRVDSPGGSAVASDSLWRELMRVKEAGKPIVVSMGATAASGGYYLATAADRVVAHPATVTGSIGVIFAKIVLAEAKAKLEIVPEEVHTGSEPSLFSVNRTRTPAQQARADMQLDSVYDVFTGRVADGRKLPIEKVREIAKGRVWTGADAASRGLVDDLGGLRRALDVALELTGAPAGSHADAKPFPKKAGIMSLLRRKPLASSEHAAGLARSAWAALTTPGLMLHLGLDPRSLWIR